MRSGNPFLGDKSFDLVERGEARMTLMGTVNKTAILLALTGVLILLFQDHWAEISAALAQLQRHLVEVCYVTPA